MEIKTHVSKALIIIYYTFLINLNFISAYPIQYFDMLLLQLSCFFFLIVGNKIQFFYLTGF